MIRDLYNVRTVPAEPGTTPLTPEEERRTTAVFFAEIGTKVAEHGWTRFPAHTPEQRRRLLRVGEMLSEHWGTPVSVLAEDECSMRFSLPGHELPPSTGTAQHER
ncbi:hypothetical protein [Streptomyces sp. NPDC048845]|uniref:hypothetical protein n=1 Tax=Streptomyces sp. NPDC048845 TaxID=3155390 RepID=UPI00341661F1